jgi:hypothetical protein
MISRGWASADRLPLPATVLADDVADGGPVDGVADRIADLSATPATPLEPVDGVADRVADLSMA